MGKRLCSWSDRLDRFPATGKKAALCLLILAWVLSFGGVTGFAFAVPPDATPAITRVQPSEAAPGSQVALKIQGQNFSTGSYVSFSNPAIHVLKTQQVSDTELDAEVAIGAKAQPGSVYLYVANSTGVAAQIAFSIEAAASSSSAAPASPVNPTPSVTASPPAAPTSSPAPGTPVVTSVSPAEAAPGAKTTVKVKGKNFVEGAKVAFSNPGIRVLETKVNKSTQLAVSIEVASDASTGKTSLFVVNPDESEAEAAFEVGAGNTKNSQPVAAAEGKQSAASAQAQQFNVTNLGDAINIFKSGNKAHGTLIAAGGKLTYQEGGKDVFVAGSSDIKEIAPNVIFGINTGTFHIILGTGKTYNFVASSLIPADTNSIVSSLQSEFK